MEGFAASLKSLGIRIDGIGMPPIARIPFVSGLQERREMRMRTAKGNQKNTQNIEEIGRKKRGRIPEKVYAVDDDVMHTDYGNALDCDEVWNLSLVSK
jgi:hypothetical protein